ncbi:MAG: MATE family efflux transporter [bacterium]|nr:MATE family efflux transporter [bacterium]
MSRFDPGRATLERRFFRLTLLNILSNITVPIAGLVDTAMLGHLDEIRFLAGVALATVIFDVIYWTFGFLRMGTTGTTAQAWGRHDAPEVYATLYRALVVAVVLAAGLLVLQWPLRELGFALLSGATGVEQAGRDYFDARIWAAPAALCNFAFLGWFLGREESRQALVMTVVANLANVVFNYVFIMRLGWAAYGAGIATTISQYLMLLTALLLFFGGGRREPCSWAGVLDRPQLRRMIVLNRDIFFRTLCLVGSFAVFTNFSSILGTSILAANAILGRVQTLAAFAIDGAAFAAESLAGIFAGRGDREALRRVFRLSLISGLVFAAAILALFFVRPALWLGLLTSHDDVVALSRTYAPWLVPTLIFGSLAFMYDGLFLGMTEGRRLRNAMVLSTAVFVPLAILAVRLESNHGLWGAMAVFMVARTWTLQRRSRQIV